MATTVYGCVNRSTGQIEFDVCDTGDFKGCIERTGEHAGQVKVIISGTGCDDTYYGCINRGTGKFQVIVPDDCCYDCPCTYSLNDCTECFAEGEAPKYLNAVVSGVRNCSDGELSVVYNGEFCLEKDFGVADCYWDYAYYLDEDLKGYLAIWLAGWDVDTTHVEIYDNVLNICFEAEKNSDCSLGTFNNELAVGDCGGGNFGYDGTIVLSNPCA